MVTSQDRLRSIAILIVVTGLLQACAQEQGPLAQRLLSDRSIDWRSIDGKGVRIHVRPGSEAETDSRTIASSVTAVRQDLLTLLGGSPGNTVPADLFFVNSRDDMQRLTGRPLIGFIQQGEPTGVFVYARDYRLTPLLRHELTHLYTFQLWGDPRAGRWLVEGVGAWASGDCQGYSLDQLAAGARERGAFVPLSHLATNFQNLSEDVAMPEAGSIVGFLVRKRGLASIQDLWRRESRASEHPLGPEGPELERQWLEEIERVRPATLDIPRVIKEGC